VSRSSLTAVVCLAALAAARAFAGEAARPDKVPFYFGAQGCTWRRAYSERAFIPATAARANWLRTVDFAQPFLGISTLTSRFAEGG
jgi:hypothetical protein